VLSLSKHRSLLERKEEQPFDKLRANGWTGVCNALEA
jgi:hypothetical protein